MDMGRGEERVRCMERVTWKLTLQNKKNYNGFLIMLIPFKKLFICLFSAPELLSFSMCFS